MSPGMVVGGGIIADAPAVLITGVLPAAPDGVAPAAPLGRVAAPAAPVLGIIVDPFPATAIELGAPAVVIAIVPPTPVLAPTTGAPLSLPHAQRRTTLHRNRSRCLGIPNIVPPSSCSTAHRRRYEIRV
jgi:hypothetical protein